MFDVDLANGAQSCLFTQRLVNFLFRRIYLKVVKCARLSHVNVCRRAGGSKSRAVSGLASLGFGKNKFIYKVNYTAPRVVIEDLFNHQEKQLTLWYFT